MGTSIQNVTTAIYCFNYNQLDYSQQVDSMLKKHLTIIMTT